MPSTVVDSGPLFALFNRSDRFHQDACAFFERTSDTLLTNLMVIGEVAYLLRRIPAARSEFLGWIASALTIDLDTIGDLPRIAALLAKYRDLPADFADASLVALAERHRIVRVASVDSDFTVYRTLGGRSFRNVLFE